MAINQSQRATWPNEALVAMTSMAVNKITTLTENPVIIIFDNQGVNNVAISVNDSTGTNVWHTFPGGEACVLDLRTQHGLAANFTADIGTTFYGAGTTGDSFSISYVAALDV